MAQEQSPTNSLFIKELIRKVQQELIDSKEERERKGEKAIFQVEKMEIEVNFVVIESANAKGGFDFKILTIGGINLAGIKEYEKQKAHKITLHLAAIPQPQDKEGLLDDFVKNSTFMPR